MSLLGRLDVVGFDDGSNQSGETFLDFRAARGIVHLHAPTLASNQASFPETLEVLRKR